LNVRKRQQQEDDKTKKSLTLSKSTALYNDKEANNSNMPKQYARVKNVVNGKDVIKDNTDQTYAFVDEFLEEVTKNSSLYVEMLSLLRTDPEVYDDKKQMHLKRFHSKVVTKIELN
jgi:hypothetical protein